MLRAVAVFDPSAPGGIDQLLTTNQSWIQTQTSTISPNLFATIAPNPQVPKILWLGCSDSRVPETSLLGLNPGEVFTHRNIANLFNPQDVSFPAVLAYGVEHVGVSLLVPFNSCAYSIGFSKSEYYSCTSIDTLFPDHSRYPLRTLRLWRCHHGDSRCSLRHGCC